MEVVADVIIKAVVVVITFGLAVFVHEFGHMFFALIRGVGVESFAIGMGPKITEWKWRGIEFSLRWLPIGGFVKLGDPKKKSSAGEDGDTAARGTATLADVEVDKGAPASQDEDKSLAESSYDDLYALQDKGFVTKVLVFGGGVFMNFVTATLAIAMVAFIGEEIMLDRTQVERISQETPAVKTGLQPGDRIVALNGQPVQYTFDLKKKINDSYDQVDPSLWEALRGKLSGKPAVERPAQFSLTVERAGRQQKLDLPAMTRSEWAKVAEGIQFHASTVIEMVIPYMPADKAGIKKGDRIVAINGQPVNSFLQITDYIWPATGKEISVTVKRGAETKTFKMTPMQSVENAKHGQIGIYPGSDEKRIERVANPLKALALAPVDAALRTAFIVNKQVEFFRKATFKQVRENVGGPIAIAVMTVKQVEGGWRYSVGWFITLNLLLMVFNLLPLPVLDGGFIALAFIEAIIRRPVPPKVLGPIYTVFVIGFIMLIVAISLQDVARMIPWLNH